MKLSDYVANWLSLYFQPEAELRKTVGWMQNGGEPPNLDVRCRVYAVCGAGAMHLNDSICNHPGIEVIPMQHEQAAAYAAECEARVTNNLSVVHVTVGPGGSNALTGVACAYVDSIPMLIIGGQVTQSQSSLLQPGTRESKLRQAGLNELDMVALMGPITKSARTITEPFMVKYHLEKAAYTAMHGRRGPVFLDIPLDVQAAEVDGEHLTGFNPVELDVDPGQDYIDDAASAVVLKLKNAKRPVLIYGNGARNAADELLRVVDDLGCPVVSSWSAADILPSCHPNLIGRCGLFGDVASNITVQNADLILAIGTRLSPAQIGHHAKNFAPEATKIVVDIDPDEAWKESIHADMAIVADAKRFLQALVFSWPPRKCNSGWLRTRQLSKKHDQVYDGEPNRSINSYDFVKHLQKAMPDDAIVVTDVGFSFIPVFQRLELKSGQRLIHSCGISPMGYALPAAIGAQAASNKPVICLTGDGGLMLNIQELHTVATRNIPMAIFVFANQGYATMRIAQMNHFKREAISGPNSNNPINADELLMVASAFGVASIDCTSRDMLNDLLPNVIRVSKADPVLIVLRMPPDQVIAPRVQAKIVNGDFAPASLTDMWFPETEYAKLDA